MIDEAMKKVIEAGEIKCDQKTNCLFCQYDDFCNALQKAYKIAKSQYQPSEND